MRTMSLLIMMTKQKQNKKTNGKKLARSLMQTLGCPVSRVYNFVVTSTSVLNIVKCQRLAL